MNELQQFQDLKEKVLLKYQEQYPFFQGNWKTFSSQDIQNLIGLIEVQCKQTISEKWIYTHLKPESNSKIPRKDMLNILSQFVEYSGWEEFIFNDISVSQKNKAPKKMLWIFALTLIFLIIIAFIYFYKTKQQETKTIHLNNEFTHEKIKSEEVNVVQVNDSIAQPLKVVDGKVQLENTTNKKSKLIIKSPFYRTRTIDLNSDSSVSQPISNVTLQPDDYAMMLKAFMLSDIKDWQTRKEQLNIILAENLEVIVMLKEDLGAEYFNKKEFSQKLIIPTASLKKMKIVEIKNDENKKIQFIRIKQE
jgi:hypothetical protein